MDKVQKIRQEIERRINLLQNGEADPEVMKRVEGVLLAYNSILEFIDSIPEEHNEDLEEAAQEYSFNIPTQLEANSVWKKETEQHFKDGAEWQKQKDLEDSLKSDMTMPNKFYEKGKADAMNEMKEALQTEYEKGRFDMREEMMKDAIECVVEDWCGDSPEITIPLNPQDFKTDDKVKIIIVKDEQQ